MLVHYATAEITGVREEAAGLELSFAQSVFHAELTAEGYVCVGAEAVAGARFYLHGTEGRLRLRRSL